MSTENSSQDLVWEIVRGSNSYLVKRRSGGGVMLSRDPMNLINKHSRKYEGFVNDRAIGVQPRPGSRSNPPTETDAGIYLTTKRPSRASQPSTSIAATTFGPNTSGRKTYRGIVNKTAKNGYRADLRREAVARASALKRSQKSERKVRESKPRGAKAKAKAAKTSA